MALVSVVLNKRTVAPAMASFFESFTVEEMTPGFTCANDTKEIRKARKKMVYVFITIGFNGD